MLSTTTFSVVIATYNRPHLVVRAIESVLGQDCPVEAVVVDDASQDDRAASVCATRPAVRYLRRELNAGPGAARMDGIRVASGEWVVILDDDDELLPGALQNMAVRLASGAGSGNAPAVFFRSTNALPLDRDFTVVSAEDLIAGRVTGDFVPVIHKRRFLDAGLEYPRLKIGAEGLLWLGAAERFGIPVWNVETVQVHRDASHRLTSIRNQMHRAAEYAELQDIYIQRFGEAMGRLAPRALRTRLMGAATYWLLAGDTGRARQRLRQLAAATEWPALAAAVAMFGLTFMPRAICRQLFLLFRAFGKASRA
ncbi:MAG: glycosyltransferase family 2 protein [Bryobacteraceae bacterium]